MKRKIEEYLLKWKANRNNALTIYGARQVGKSYSIENFIAENFKNYCIIDFAKMPDALEMFEAFDDTNDFYKRLSFYNVNLDDDTVIFFDEIQELYIYREKKMKVKEDIYIGKTDLISLTKYLVKEKRSRYIFSGSMLGVTINNVIVNPTGYMDLYRMFPLDFEEYLWANDIKSDVIDYLHDCFNKKVPVNEAIHKKINRMFLEYIIVGGMPNAALTYITTKDLNETSIIHDNILNFYKSDIIKYAPKDDKLILIEVFESLASEVNDINKRFIKTHMNISNIKNMDLVDKYLWLTFSGIAIPVYNVTEPKFPLKLSEDRKVLKLFYSDIGLLSHKLLGVAGKIKYLSGDIEVNFGAAFENVIAEELLSHGYNNINYYNSKKIGEVDFIIEKDTKIIPIEVKSGKSKKNVTYNHNTLDNVLNTLFIK